MSHNIKHLAIIPDGNYRFAEQQNISYPQALDEGAKRIREAVEWCYEQHIPEVTVWLFSTENMKRADDKINAVRTVVKSNNVKLKEELAEKDNKLRRFKINIIGDLEEFQKEWKEEITEMKEWLPEGNELQVNFALHYGGRNEMLQTVKKIMKEAEAEKINSEALSEEYIAERLMVKNDVDVVIRAGGEQRMSGFLPWQSAYAEFFFLEKMWPDVTKEDLDKVVEEYSKRKRRFGR